MATPSNGPDWWLSREPSGQFQLYLASMTIKQSTLIRHSFEAPVHHFRLAWHPLSAQSHVIEFRVTDWQILDPHTLEKRGDSTHLAGLFSFTVDTLTGDLLTVLAGPMNDQRLQKFQTAAEALDSKITRQEIVAHFVEYTQDAAQEMAQDVWRLICSLWSPKRAQEFKIESEKEVEVHGVKLNARTVTRQTTDKSTFCQAFSKVSKAVSWSFEDIDPEHAAERYSALPERLPDDALRGAKNDFSILLTPDQFDFYTLQEEFNRSLTVFCLKHNPSKFRKRRWEAMRCTSQIYLLDERAITVEGVSDTRRYEVQSFADGRPVMVNIYRDQESTITLNSRSQFSHRTNVSRGWVIWDGDSPYSDMAVLKQSVKDFHLGFQSVRHEVESRFAGLYKLAPQLQIRLQKAFTFLDVHRDGTLDFEELRNVLSRVHTRRATEEETQRAMKDLDPSGNGTIEPSEFVKYMSEHGTDQASLLPLSRLDVMCRAGFEAKKKKALSTSSCYVEVDPFAQVLSIYDSKAGTLYDPKVKAGYLKKTLDLKERDMQADEPKADGSGAITFTKRSNTSSLTLLFSANNFKPILELLQRCVDRDSSFAAEAKPLVQSLLVEAALPALVAVAD